jgi:serine/threonine kinase PknH
MAKRSQERYASAGELAAAAHQALSAPHQAQEFRILKRSDESGMPNEAAAAAGLVTVSPSPLAKPDPDSSTAQRDVDISEPLPSPPSVAPSSVTVTASTGPADPPEPPAEQPTTPPATPVPEAQPIIPPSSQRPSTPITRLRNPRILIGAIALVILVVFAAQGIWLSLRPDNTSTAPKSGTATSAAATTTQTSTMASADALARLLSLLPLGYPPAACRPFLPPKDALARVLCDANVDPGGPTRAIFTVFGETETLRQFFDDILRTDLMVNCPGEAKSPTEWHHADSPQIGGMAFCAVQESNPSLVWTNEAQLMIGLVQGDPQGPSLEQLDAWWKKHR